jgi:cellulose 1,4-beta-cellobiosidase
MVDLGAPGVSVLSTIRNNAYAYFSGTSMATPHVSGAAALVLAACPALSTASLRSAILGTVDPIASMAGITVTGGRLNVNNAVRSCSGSPQPPPAPTGLTATAGNAQVTLNWNASSGATGYNVYRGTAPGQEGAVPLNASPVAALSYTDTTAQNGTTYYYKVTAVNANGQSAPSNEAVATPTAPPAVPPPPTITRTFPSTNSIAVVWTSSSGATSYRLKRLINGQFQVVQTTTATYVIDSGLASHTTYTYVVTAVNAAGESAPSNQVSATTQ